MRAIYCCGPYGNVGWVAGWKYAQTSYQNVISVRLTLNHRDAYAFDSRGPHSVERMEAVMAYLRSHEDIYGSVEVMRRGAS